MSKVERQVSGLSEKLKVALSIDGLKAKVGWTDGAKYENGMPVAYVAAIQEFGSTKNNIPPRSFMRSTSSEKSAVWAGIAESGAKAAISGNATAHDVMDGLGMAAAGDIRKKIAQIQSPALAASTVKGRQRKLANSKKVGSLTKPLVETGLMAASLSSTVE